MRAGGGEQNAEGLTGGHVCSDAVMVQDVGGVEVARLVQKDQWGFAAVYREGRVTKAPISDLMKAARLVDPNHRWVKLAQSLQIFI